MHYLFIVSISEARDGHIIVHFLQLLEVLQGGLVEKAVVIARTSQAFHVLELGQFGAKHPALQNSDRLRVLDAKQIEAIRLIAQHSQLRKFQFDVAIIVFTIQRENNQIRKAQVKLAGQLSVDFQLDQLPKGVQLIRVEFP